MLDKTFRYQRPGLVNGINFHAHIAPYSYRFRRCRQDPPAGRQFSSAFGALRTYVGGRAGSLSPLLTQSGHRGVENSAVQQH